MGGKAVSLTGAQAGIITDGVHTKAKIANITPKQIHRYLDDGNIVIVAGFQGETPTAASPRSAAAAATSPPSPSPPRSRPTSARSTPTWTASIPATRASCPNARKIDEISYDEMLEMASSGSKVMQSRSVEFAKKFGVVFEVRSSFNNNPGTIVKEETKDMENVVVRGVSIEKNQAKVTIRQVPDRPGTAAQHLQRARRREHHRRHDRAERPRRRHQRHLLHAEQGRTAQAEPGARAGR